MIDARRRAAVKAMIACGALTATRAAALGSPAVLGYLSPGPRELPAELTQDLARLGHDARTLRVEVRIETGRDRAKVRAAAEALARSRPDLLLAWGSERVAALAAATRTIPIVAGTTADPVGEGYATTLQHPTGNVTGLSIGVPEMARMWMSLLKTVRPRLERVAIIRGSADPEVWSHVRRPQLTESEGSAVRVIDAYSTTAAEADRTLAELGDPERAGAVGAVDGVNLAQLALRRRIAFVGDVRDGGLMMFGLQFGDAYARTALTIDKLLRGAKPADIPFEGPDRSFLELNRATARAIGVTFPKDLLLRATLVVD